MSLLFLLPSLLVGCAGSSTELQPLPPIPDRVTGYHATAEISWKHGAARRKGRVALAFRSPRTLRIELLDPLGGVSLALISAAEGALLLDPARRSYRCFPDGESAMEALSGLRFPPERLAMLLLGPAPIPAIAPPGTDGPTGGEGHPPGSGDSPPRGDGPPTRDRIESGDGDVRVRWERDDGSASTLPPRVTEFRRSDRRGTLRVSLSDLRFAIPDPDIFRLDPPEGFRPEGDSTGDPPAAEIPP